MWKKAVGGLWASLCCAPSPPLDGVLAVSGNEVVLCSHLTSTPCRQGN